MNKEEARKKLRKAERDLRIVNDVLKMHEQGVQEIKNEIAKLEAIINKPERWQDGLVQPEKEEYFYLTSYQDKGLVVSWGSECNRKPEHAFRTREQVELIKEKTLLMWEMYAFAHVKNGDWVADWGNGEQAKYGVIQIRDEIKACSFTYSKPFVFGVAVKSSEIAEEMIKEFGERIKKFYNKMY